MLTVPVAVGRTWAPPFPRVLCCKSNYAFGHLALHVPTILVYDMILNVPT